MSLILGCGACEALLDALSVTHNLIARLMVTDALAAAYDNTRRRPTRRLAHTAALAFPIAHAHRLTALRDIAIRLSLLMAPRGNDLASPCGEKAAEKEAGVSPKSGTAIRPASPARHASSWADDQTLLLDPAS